MTVSPGKREVFANPFFVVLMVTSVVFVLTVLAYLVSPAVLAPANAQPLGDSDMLPPPPRSAGSLAFAAWLDHYAPWALALEFGIMLVTGVLAMVTDPWFTPRPKPKPPA